MPSQIAYFFFSPRDTPRITLREVVISDVRKSQQYQETYKWKARHDTAHISAAHYIKHLQEATGVIQLSGQAEATLRTIALLRAELVNRELQLQQLRSVATENNENVSSLETSIAALREQLVKAEKGNNDSGTADYFLPAGKVPAAGLEYVRKVRQLRYHEALYETLSKQYEIARIDEAKSAPLLQVVDRAIAVDKRAWPPRTLLVLLSGLISALFVSIYILLKDTWKRAAIEPANAEQLNILRTVLNRRDKRTS